MDKMVHAIEKNQKTLNCLESGNYRRRQKINTLRKDRAVFDKIFKGIEVKILSEERQMIRRIKSLRKQEARLAKVEDNLAKLEKVIGEDHREKLVQEIESVYKKNFLDYSGHGDDEEFLTQLSPEAELEIRQDSTDRMQNVISVDFRTGGVTRSRSAFEVFADEKVRLQSQPKKFPGGHSPEKENFE